MRLTFRRQHAQKAPYAALATLQNRATRSLLKLEALGEADAGLTAWVRLELEEALRVSAMRTDPAVSETMLDAANTILRLLTVRRLRQLGANELAQEVLDGSGG